MIVAGAIFGPAAYYTGEGFGAITFQLSPLLSTLIIGAIWAEYVRAGNLYGFKGKLRFRKPIFLGKQ